MKKLAIISTHPIQYYAPLFKLLQAERELTIKVFYTLGEEAGKRFDQGFGKAIEWDIPLLDGYSYAWVQNVASDKGSHHFLGIINPGLIGAIEDWQPDALLVYGWANYSHLKVLRHFKHKLPVFFRGDSTLLGSSGKLKSFFRKMVLKWVYSHTDYALYVGMRNKAYFSAFGLKEKQLIFAPHAIDNLRFSQKRAVEVKDFRSRLRLSDHDILLVFAGKFEQNKDPLLLLTSFLQIWPEADQQTLELHQEQQLQYALQVPAETTGQNIPQQHAEVHLLFVGNGALEQQLKSAASAHSRIHFLDFQNQQMMPVIYQSCDLFCLPSVSETWGLAVNEAMACSTAVLVSDQVGCAADLLKDGINGAVFKAKSANNLRETLVALVQQGRSGLTLMGQHSALIIDQWTFDKQVQAITAAVFTYG
ncbi:glycosyltransferase family 4 protein [Pedobacter sp. AW31-3R]|uniref:glycosyltransferase family 4 protein n=1 Tax=Pedobacter sp. AW31-3R TaxID=3445781 RepID=UPI003F9F4CF3